MEAGKKPASTFSGELESVCSLMDQEIWGIYRTAGHRREVREIQRNEAAAQRSFSPEILTAAGCVSMQSQIRFGYSVQRLSGWHRISRLHQDKAILSPAEACPTALCTTTPRKQFGKTFMIWQYSELVEQVIGRLVSGIHQEIQGLLYT